MALRTALIGASARALLTHRQSDGMVAHGTTMWRGMRDDQRGHHESCDFETNQLPAQERQSRRGGETRWCGDAGDEAGRRDGSETQVTKR